MCRPDDRFGVIEGLSHVRDKDEDVEGEAEAVPDKPEDEVDPGGGSDSVDEQAGRGHTHYRETDPCAPRDCAHNGRCVSLHLSFKNAGKLELAPKVSQYPERKE